MLFEIREIQLQDNPYIAKVIRKSLEEYGVARPGTVYTDPTTDNLYELFRSEKSKYFIALDGDKVIGGCGVYPTKGLPEGCAELVKLYVSADARGRGVGFELMKKSAEAAKEFEYSKLYLETLPELDKAVTLYERSGYVKLSGPLGDSGHFACTIWMLKEL